MEKYIYLKIKYIFNLVLVDIMYAPENANRNNVMYLSKSPCIEWNDENISFLTCVTIYNTGKVK